MDSVRPGTVVRLTNYEDPKSLGSRLRARRSGPLRKLIMDAHAAFGHVNLLDVGGRKSYWNILPPGFLEQHRVTVTLLNLPGELGGPDDSIFRHVAGDSTNLTAYADKSFHVVHSNSVIEHVGGWQNVRKFASECRRVALGLFVQTPYFWFPIEPHYMAPLFHWLPRPVQESLVLRFPLGYSATREPNLDAAISAIEGAPRLLDLRTYRLLFPDCEIIKERFFMLTKSIVALRPVS